MALAARIIEERKMKLLSQAGLAYRIDVDVDTVAAWEANEAYPEIGHLLRLSRLFQVDLDTLIGSDLAMMATALERAGEKKWLHILLTVLIAGFTGLGPLLHFNWNGGVFAGVCLLIVGLVACYHLFKIQYAPRLKVYSQILAFMAE